MTEAIGWAIGGAGLAILALWWFAPIGTRRAPAAFHATPAEAFVFLDETRCKTIVANAPGTLKLRLVRSDASGAAERISIPSLNAVHTVSPGRTTTVDLELQSSGVHAILDGEGNQRAVLIVDRRAR